MAKLKTRTYHITNLGSFAPYGIEGVDGYVRYHDHSRYARATPEQLDKWAMDPSRYVRNAAITERCIRRLTEWQSRPQSTCSKAAIKKASHDAWVSHVAAQWLESKPADD